ncbi:hypothetical protein J6590_077503 [Homalodisca vitripennis]|nr:hypothetical protein J6590_077503 [Homalodisca vitripennis]
MLYRRKEKASISAFPSALGCNKEDCLNAAYSGRRAVTTLPKTWKKCSLPGRKILMKTEWDLGSLTSINTRRSGQSNSPLMSINRNAISKNIHANDGEVVESKAVPVVVLVFQVGETRVITKHSQKASLYSVLLIYVAQLLWRPNHTTIFK